ncbi:hypothetical protein [Afifella sp. IM 167]|uniref:hypothetical protein n=1 Tax=Afifella sp. IM 167 TaxID=2033586 RepID=UPI001CCC2684|nr:hypothetical protein [Afifella sp. IM 167]MBZ8132962.1 hypothetical protein [Afifella sp. IM 167]
MRRYVMIAIAAAIAATTFTASAEAESRTIWDGPDEKLELIIRNPNAHFFNNSFRRATTLEPNCRYRNVEVYNRQIGGYVIQRRMICD